ncbi:hypothetical protein A8F94_03785 [Bacillus sp. FJAT-27225]|uniref:GrpB family protein n=1 Tax=Bacillus sp. FJAT-27225 TaxID=1743144 RepID=UPI00080C2E0A|nr:GrpB family protein [Bacillus sp. FJAT-27225]OCA90998.1 hypothetical protein A8F94_03785 [Bacillus sp. FJAT-27225]
MTPRRVEVIPYSTDWPIKFETEKKLLLEVLDGEGLILHHIGSTSVPGLSAKPIIDILAEADSLAIFDRNEDKMSGAGYIARGENGIPGRRYFVKASSTGDRIVHLHAYQLGSPHAGRHLYFRDYLIAHPKRASSYGNIKEEAAKKFPYDIDSYIQYKHGIASEIECEAIQWANKKE